MLLARVNHHPRDDRVQFHEAEHFYTVDGRRYGSSVSGVVHHFFPVFNAEDVIDRCYDSWVSSKTSRYYQLITYLQLVMGLTDERMIKKQIADLWTANGRSKAGYGTGLHRCIELYLNNEPFDVEVPQEFSMFLGWWEQKQPRWKPYRTEWSIFTEEYEVAGQIDAVFVDTETGLYHMVDWKCVENMEGRNKYGETGSVPFEDFANCNLLHYTIQQNLYKYMLETLYGIQISTMRLLQLHKSCPIKEWELNDIQDRMPEALSMFRDSRRLKLSASHTSHTSDTKTSEIKDEGGDGDYQIDYEGLGLLRS